MVKFRDVLDGLANTIMGGELNTDLGDNHLTTRVIQEGWILNDPSLCDDQMDPQRPTFWMPDADFASNSVQVQRGYKWINGLAVNTGITIISPPNGPVCSNGNNTFTMASTAPAVAIKAARIS